MKNNHSQSIAELQSQLNTTAEGLSSSEAERRLSEYGENRLKEAKNSGESCEVCPQGQGPFSFQAMLPLAIATSIDALAVGVTLAFLQVKILPAITFIGVTTFVISGAGIRIGNLFGSRWKSKAELAGGIILLCMGIKILLEHLGVLG